MTGDKNENICNQFRCCSGFSCCGIFYFNQHRNGHSLSEFRGSGPALTRCSRWRRLSAALILLITVLSGPTAADHGPQSFKAIEGSVVRVLPTWPGYDRPGFGAPIGTAPEGTGFAITPPSSFDKIKTPRVASHYLLTAAHVVDRASRIEVLSPDGTRADAILLASDPRTDLALLKLPFTLPPVVFTLATPAVGSHACAVGNSFGLGISFSCGVVSATGRKGIGFNAIEDFVQIDAAVNPGASGGLLVNGAGQGLGLIDAIFTKSEDSDAGVNFAISARLIDTVITAWADKGDVFTH